MKRIALLLTLLIVLAIPTIKVNAVDISELICDNDNVYDIKKKASNMKTTYEFREDKENGKHFKIKVSNLDPSLEIRVYGTKYNYLQDGSTFYLMQPFGINGGKVDLLIYGSSTHACNDQYVTTVTVKLPKYNIYSELDECVEYEEFQLCNRFYGGEIKSVEDFRKRLNDYIAEINKKTEKVKEPNVIERILIFIEDNQALSAIIGLVILAIIIAIIVRKIIRRKKRVKIKM